MKKYAVLLLLLCLLTGCAGQGDTPQADAQLPEASETPADAASSPGPAPQEEDNASSSVAAVGGVDNEQVVTDIDTETPISQEAPAPGAEPEGDAPPADDPALKTADALLAGMTLEEKVGQLFFVRCPTAAQAEKVSQYHLGGYLLFTRDFQDAEGQWLTGEAFSAKVNSYQAAAAIPLLIGVDEEGGSVTRASRNPNLFPAKRKSPQRLYAAGGMEAIAEDALSCGSTLLSWGINVNFAPVADVSVDPEDFIYDRTFGMYGTATAEYVSTVVAAMGQCAPAGGAIGSVLKHFPGYGSNADTHTGAAIDQRPYERFTSEDFLPFQAGIDAGADAVLICHNIVACMDAEVPASLSPQVHRVLREELGFTGVALTDDLAMEAVTDYARSGSAAVLAVLAGNDMVVTTDFETQIPQVIAAAEEGTIPLDTIDQAVRRVLLWKYRLGLLTLPEGAL